MSALATTRLALRRELLTRRWLLLLGPAAVLGGLLLPDATAAAWQLFVALVLLPGLALTLGGGLRPEADRWWAGQRGPPSVHALSRAALHLSLLWGCGAAAAWLAGRGIWEGGPVTARLGWLLIAALLALLGGLYGSGATARRTHAGLSFLVGPLTLLSLLALGGLADWQLGAWSVLEGATLRGLGLALLFCAANVKAEGRLLPPRFHRLAYGLAALFTALSVAAHAGWSARPLLLPPTPADLRPDGEAALYVHGPAAFLAPRRALLWQDGRWSTVGPAGAVDAAFGPEQTMAFVTGDLFHRAATITLALHAGGEHRRCAFERAGHDGERWAFPMPGDSSATLVFAPDGSAVATRLVVEGEVGVAVAWRDGRCEFLPGTPGKADAIAWTSAGQGWSLALSPAAPADPGLGAAGSPRQAELRDGRLLDPGSGRSAPAPDVWSPAWPLVLPHGDGLRAFYDGGPIVDLGPEGERARYATTLLDALGG